MQQGDQVVRCTLHGHVNSSGCGLTTVLWKLAEVICRNVDHGSVEVLVLATRNLEHPVLRVPDVAKVTEHLA